MHIVETRITFKKSEYIDKMSNNLIFFTAGGFVANNAGNILIKEVDHGVRVTADPFLFNAASGGGVLDHVKVLYLTQPQSVGPEEIYEVKTRFRGKIHQPESLPSFVSDKNDPRLGSAIFVTISDDFLVLDFVLTNDKIYALYERLPFGWNNGPYSAFTSVHFLKKRKPQDIHDLKLVIDKKNRKITWTADNKSVSIKHPGLQPGKSYNGKTFNDNFNIVLSLIPPGDVSIQTDTPQLNSFQSGPGLFTLMDMGNFDYNPFSGSVSSSSSDSSSNSTQSPLPSQGYLQLKNTPYAYPTDWLYDFTLPFTGTAQFSNDPNTQTTYGQGGYFDIFELKYTVDRH